MSTTDGGPRTPGRTTVGRSTPRRRLVVLAAMLLLVVPLGYLVLQVWSYSGDEVGVVEAERRGVAYVRPLVPLVASVTAAQSAAVRGDDVQTGAVREAIKDVDAADAQFGARLDSTTRWTAVRDRVEKLIEAPPGGAAAYRSFSEVTDLLLALVAKVVDTTGLAVDGELSSHYLIESALLHVPVTLVDAGCYADLLRLAEDADAEQKDAYTAQAAVAWDQVGDSAATADETVRRGLDATGERGPGLTLISRVDAFRTAASDLAPLEQLGGEQRGLPTAAWAAAQRDRLAQVAVELDQATLAEVDRQLAERESDVSTSRTGVIIAGVLALGGVVWVLWRLLPAQRAQRHGASADPDEDEPMPAGALSDGAVSEDELILLDARELLGQGELVRIGRAVKRSRQDPNDAQ